MSTEVDALEPYPRALAESVLAAYERWLVARVMTIAAQGGVTVDQRRRDAIVEHAREARDALGTELLVLLATDVDEQRKNPLQVIRESTLHATAQLTEWGAVPPHRDEFEQRAMPEDVFGIGPLAWRDLGDEVHDAGIEWGAWKAATVLTRRRAEGKLD